MEPITQSLLAGDTRGRDSSGSFSGQAEGGGVAASRSSAKKSECEHQLLGRGDGGEARDGARGGGGARREATHVGEGAMGGGKWEEFWKGTRLEGRGREKVTGFWSLVVPPPFP